MSYRPKRRFRADQPFVPYQGVWRPFPVTYHDATYPDRALVVWSVGKQRLDEQKRKGHLKALLDRLAEIHSHLNRGRYIRREYAAQQIALAQRGNSAKGLVVVQLTGEDRHLAMTFHIDRMALAQAQSLDGKYLLGTNAPHLTISQPSKRIVIRQLGVRSLVLGVSSPISSIAPGCHPAADPLTAMASPLVLCVYSLGKVQSNCRK